MPKMTKEEKEKAEHQHVLSLFDTPEKREYWKKECSMSWSSAPPIISKHIILEYMKLLEEKENLATQPATLCAEEWLL